MLKIGTKKPMPVEEPLQEAPEGLPAIDPLSDEAQVGEAVDNPTSILPKALVVYMTGDLGPFRCDNCCYYKDPGQCQVVEGEIDPAGCCNMFCPPDHGQMDAELGPEQAEMEPTPDPDAMAEGSESPIPPVV